VPHERVVAKGHDRKRSLGWLALAWTEFFCVHGPGDVQGDAVVHGEDSSAFVADCYVLDDRGRLRYDSAFLSRPKGADKSGLAARLAMFEALGPCRFAGWAKGGEVYRDPWGLGFRYVYQQGEPMGRPVRVPYVRIMATEEGQTGNVFDAIYVNLTEGKLARVPGLKVGLTGISLPGGGEIMPSTASGASKDGGKETFAVFDETHLYKTPELRRMYATVTRNLRKRKKTAGTWFIETTTMFAAGEDSVAESSYELAEQIREGKTRREKLLFDHRYGECEDLTDEEALRAALVEAYGEAEAWIFFDGLVDEFYDPRNDPADSRRYFLNSKSTATDAWVAEWEWVARFSGEAVVADSDVVVLGFDGSRKRTRTVTDATALIGCRVHDGHVFEIGVWEQPSGVAGAGWQVPVAEVEAALRSAFRRWKVVGFFADPAKWETYIASWEAEFGARLAVKASREHPIQWWMNRPTVTVRALEQYHGAIVDGEMSHDGSDALTRHHLNARRRASQAGLQIAKEHPESSRKIDGAIAATLAWQARLAALAAGVGKVRTAPRRLN